MFLKRYFSQREDVQGLLHCGAQTVIWSIGVMFINASLRVFLVSESLFQIDSESLGDMGGIPDPQRLGQGRGHRPDTAEDV